jgi:hypothetical protein
MPKVVRIARHPLSENLKINNACPRFFQGVFGLSFGAFIVPYVGVQGGRREIVVPV